MKTTLIVAVTMLLPAGVMAQEALPHGTILPISLERGLDSSRVHPGQEIRAKVMQDIPGTGIRRGAEVLGHVLQVTSSRTEGTSLAFHFDSIRVNGQLKPLKANLRALASPSDVEDAQVGMYGPDAGIAFNIVTTQQIGGDENDRGGGPVLHGSVKIGRSTPYGVLVVPASDLERHCRGVVGDNSQPQALWLFSSDACGVYGFTNIQIEHAGRTDPTGDIVLKSESGKLNMNSQSGLLLRIQGS